jgi:hypothetical protein
MNAGSTPARVDSSLLVFLFTDLVDSTGWNETLRDAAYARDILQSHYDHADGLSWLAHGPDRCKESDDPLEVCEVGVPGQQGCSAVQ